MILDKSAKDKTRRGKDSGVENLRPRGQREGERRHFLLSADDLFADLCYLVVKTDMSVDMSDTSTTLISVFESTKSSSGAKALWGLDATT